MILIVIAIYISSYLVPDGIAYGLCVEGLIVAIALSCFLKTDYHKSVEKALWFCIFLHTITNAICFTWFDSSYSFSKYIFAGESLFFGIIYIYSKYRTYDIKSDEYDDNGTFVVLKCPKNFIDYLLSFFFIPVSSLSVVAKGQRYGFKKGEPFGCRKYIPKEYHRYIKIGIDKFTVDVIFKSYIGQEWEIGCNCCHIIQKLFEKQHTFKKLDGLPSYLTRTIMELRG